MATVIFDIEPYIRMARAVCGRDMTILFLGIKEPQPPSLDNECETLLKKFSNVEPLKIGTFQSGLKATFDAMLRKVISQAYEDQNQKTKPPCVIS